MPFGFFSRRYRPGPSSPLPGTAGKSKRRAKGKAARRARARNRS